MLDAYFIEIGQPIPDVDIQLDWPDVTPERRETLAGMCLSAWFEDDGVVEEIIYTKIFIAPDIVENIQVLEVLVHELVHASVGCGCLHEEPFPTVAAQMGLVGKVTASHGNLTLLCRLLNISNTLGLYPEGD